MAKTPKRPRDPNQLAKAIVDIATGEAKEHVKAAPQVKGGEIGGKRRAKALSPEQRADIARHAATARLRTY